MTACIAEDCETTSRARGYCSRHYMLFRSHGKTLTKVGTHPYFLRGRTACSIDGCAKHVASLEPGYCAQHNYKFKRYGDPLAGRTFRARGSGSTYTDTNGYIVVRSPGGAKCLQHRLVMAQMIGRELLPHENVHHINGIRDDNRPDNLGTVGDTAAHRSARGGPRRMGADQLPRRSDGRTDSTKEHRMKVRMKAVISGTRNGVNWPAPGGEVIVPDDEGKSLCEQGYADPVAAPKKAETRPAARKAEKR